MKRFFDELEKVGFSKIIEEDESVSYCKKLEHWATDINVIDKFHLMFTFQYKDSECICEYKKNVPTNIIRCWCHYKLTLEDILERIEEGNVGKMFIKMMLEIKPQNKKNKNMELETLKYATELDSLRKVLETKMLFIGTNREQGLKICDIRGGVCHRLSDEEAKMLQDNLGNQIEDILNKIKEL